MTNKVIRAKTESAKTGELDSACWFPCEATQSNGNMVNILWNCNILPFFISIKLLKIHNLMKRINPLDRINTELLWNSFTLLLSNILVANSHSSNSSSWSVSGWLVGWSVSNSVGLKRDFIWRIENIPSNDHPE